MSAAPSPVFGETPQRLFPRRPINVPLDLIALRSGIPENLPGRCTDLSEAGVGVVVAGELAAGQQVGLALRLPNTGVSIRTRALVRYQSRFHCGLEFVGLAPEQREAIRYWGFRSAPQPTNYRDFNQEKQVAGAEAEAPIASARRDAKPQAKIRIGRRGLYVLLAVMLALAGLGWWQWQRAWSELEGQTPVAATGSVVTPETVSAETMAKRIVTKVDPVYPEAARAAGTQGMVVLDAVIAPDGSVKSLRPLSGPDLLAQSATLAVRSWKFEPYLSSGSAVEVETTIAVEFRLN
jgi:TonB family protein